MGADVIPLTKKSEPLEGRSDDDLMLLASRGVREAFETLVRRHAGRVIGFCAKQLGDVVRGEEVAQEVWISVYTHLADYRPEGKFVAWLFTVARNRVRNVGRDTQAARAVETRDSAPALEAADLSPSALDRLLAEERRTRIDRSLSLVSKDLREAVVLRFGSELSYDEIARVLSTNESTARSRVFHGLRELRRRLRGER